MRERPIKFRVMGFEPICAKNNIVCANRDDVEFGAFLMKVMGGVGNTNVLNSSVTNRAILVYRAIDITDLERLIEGA